MLEAFFAWQDIVPAGKLMEEGSQSVTSHLPLLEGAHVTVSLTDFGLISTFETDYTLEVVQHSVSIILIRQMYSTNVCTSFCLLKMFVPQNVIKSEPNLYLVVSLTAQ